MIFNKNIAKCFNILSQNDINQIKSGQFQQNSENVTDGKMNSFFYRFLEFINGYITRIKCIFIPVVGNQLRSVRSPLIICLDHG